MVHSPAKHQWSSGRIVPCHGTDPGSIPGWCIFFLPFLFLKGLSTRCWTHYGYCTHKRVPDNFEMKPCSFFKCPSHHMTGAWGQMYVKDKKAFAASVLLWKLRTRRDEAKRQGRSVPEQSNRVEMKKHGDIIFQSRSVCVEYQYAWLVIWSCHGATW